MSGGRRSAACWASSELEANFERSSPHGGHFGNDHGNGPGGQADKGQDNGQQADADGQGAVFDFFLHQRHKRIHEIGQQQGDRERDEHAGKMAEQADQAPDEGGGEGHAHHAVEGVGFGVEHGVSLRGGFGASGGGTEERPAFIRMPGIHHSFIEGSMGFRKKMLFRAGA